MSVVPFDGANLIEYKRSSIDENHINEDIPKIFEKFSNRSDGKKRKVWIELHLSLPYHDADASDREREWKREKRVGERPKTDIRSQSKRTRLNHRSVDDNKQSSLIATSYLFMWKLISFNFNSKWATRNNWKCGKTQRYLQQTVKTRFEYWNARILLAKENFIQGIWHRIDCGFLIDNSNV